MLTHIITVSQPREAGGFLVRLLSKQEISGIELQFWEIEVPRYARSAAGYQRHFPSSRTHNQVHEVYLYIHPA